MSLRICVFGSGLVDLTNKQPRPPGRITSHGLAGASREGKFMSDFLISGDSRETSMEIIEAISFLANGNDAIAERIWSDPTEPELLAIWERATNNGLISDNDFCWGASGSKWMVKHNRALRGA